MERIAEGLWPEIIYRVREVIVDSSDCYLVGGIVRDALKRRPIHDIDLVTSASGTTLARRIANAFQGAFYPIDQERDTGRAIITVEGERFFVDVARFRGDILEDDLRAREFTINAMAVPLHALTELIDPLGGYADLYQHKVLRIPAPNSIEADPIRAIRAVRFALAFNLSIIPETREAIRAGAALLVREDGRLRQPERCRDEFFKLLALEQPVTAALQTLERLGLLDVLLPVTPPDLTFAIRKAGWLRRLLTLISDRRDDNSAANLPLAVAVTILDRNRAALREHFSRIYGEGRPRYILLYLAALTPPGEPGRWLPHFHLSRAEDRILQALDRSPALSLFSAETLTDRDIHQYFRQMSDAGIDAVITALADVLARQGLDLFPPDWGDLLEYRAAPLLDSYHRRHAQVIAPRPLLDGNTIKKLCPGITGRAIGDLHLALVEAQAAGEVSTRAEAAAFIRDRFFRGIS